MLQSMEAEFSAISPIKFKIGFSNGGGVSGHKTHGPSGESSCCLLEVDED